MSELLTVKEQNAYRATLEKLSKDELTAMFNELADSQTSGTWELSAKTSEALIVILNDFELGLSSQLAGGMLTLSDKLQNNEKLSFYDIKVIQTILVSAKINNVDEAKIVFDALKGVESINIALMNDELRFRHISEYIERVNKEAQTGLQHKDGDAELALEASENVVQKLEKAKSPKMSKV